MSTFSAYNLTNQRLDNEKLRALLSFCSDNFGGAITETPVKTVISISNTTASINGNYNLLLDGFLVKCSLGESYDFSSATSGTLWSINIPVSVASGINNNIITNNIPQDSVTIDTSSGLTVAINDGVYSFLHGADVEVSNYHYQTIIYDDKYIIPLACKIDNTIYRLLGCMSKSRLEDFLTNSAIDQIKAWANDKFVWQAGGTAADPNYKNGNIGDLNISGATIKLRPDNPHNYTAMVLDSPYIRFPKLANASGSGTVYSLEGNDGVLMVAKSDSYETADHNYKGLIYPIDAIGVNYGGTGAKNKTQAKINLGFYQGTGEPGTGTSANAAIGDIYFKILT